MSNILNYLYPARCPACRRILDEPDGMIHEECRRRFRPIREPRCFKCGRHLEESEADICEECRAKSHVYSYGFSLYEYDETARLSMIDYKKNGVRSNGDFFAAEVAGSLGGLLKRMDPEVLIPVPVTGRRFRERGFNQSEYLAERIGNLLDIPVDPGTLKRTGRVLSQKSLSGRERAVNSAHSFKCLENSYKSVCLIDDVYTTGSTLNGCARALKESGVQKIGFLTVFSGSVY